MQALATTKLQLEPLTVGHAEDMFAVLRSPLLYEYLDPKPPASIEHLRERYARLERRQSPDGAEQWLNWVVRHNGHLIGFVQATLTKPGTA